MVRLGSFRLGAERVGGAALKTISLDANSTSTLSQNINRTFTLTKTATSTSTTSFGLVRVFVVNLNSTSVSAYDLTQKRIRSVDLTASSNSTFSLTLSEESYAEQYGRERGNAELDIIVVGNAEVD